MAELSRQPLRFAVALDDRLVHGSFGATEQTPGGAFDAIGVAAQKEIFERFDFYFNADAAAKFSRTTTVRA